MPDLGDDTGTLVSDVVRQVAMEALRELVRRLMRGSDDQQELAKRLRSWSAETPQDPFTAIHVSDRLAMKRLQGRLERDGIDFETYKSYVCVHQSQVAYVMDLATGIGVKDAIHDPVTHGPLRRALVVDCANPDLARSVMGGLHALGIDSREIPTRPGCLAVMATDREIVSLMEVLRTRGVPEEAVHGTEASRERTEHESAPETGPEAVVPTDGHDGREPGTKEVATSDRIVEVATSDRTDYVSSDGQDAVEAHDAEDDRAAALRENAERVVENDPLKEQLARVDAAVEARDAGAVIDVIEHVPQAR